MYNVLCYLILETSPRKQKIDQALISMIVKDLVPTSMIEDEGFKDFVSHLDPRLVD